MLRNHHKAATLMAKCKLLGTYRGRLCLDHLTDHNSHILNAERDWKQLAGHKVLTQVSDTLQKLRKYLFYF